MKTVLNNLLNFDFLLNLLIKCLWVNLFLNYILELKVLILDSLDTSLLSKCPKVHRSWFLSLVQLLKKWVSISFHNLLCKSFVKLQDQEYLLANAYFWALFNNYFKYDHLHILLFLLWFNLMMAINFYFFHTISIITILHHSKFYFLNNSMI